ncbi:hypothetical protein EYS09_36775, partial [Streptomyces kasugaensis]
MSLITLVLLVAAALAVALGAAALHTVRALRRQLTDLHAELVAARTDTATAAAGAAIPAARATPVAETPLADIRAAVADALAEERERELAEARAFWAAQEARDAADAPSLLGGLIGIGEEGPLDARADGRELSERLDLDRLDGQPFLPRQADLAGLEPLLGPDALEPMGALESVEALEALDGPEFGPVEEA